MILIITIMLGVFAAATEALITATIMPTIIAQLGGFDLYPWVANAFLLSFLIVTPLYGKLSDLYGSKKIYLSALLLFMIGSFLSGSAQTMTQLILFRVVQGAGSAGLITMSFIIFGLIFPVEKRARMQALLSTMWALASLLGPSLGSTLVELSSWRWAFYINLPIGLFILPAFITLAKLPQTIEQRTLDFRGAILFGISALTMVYALIGLSKIQFNASLLLAVICSIGAFILLKKQEAKTSSPFLSFQLFQDSKIRNSLLLAAFSGLFLFAIAAFLPVFIQGVKGETIRSASYLVTVMACGNFAGALISGGLLNKVGFRIISMFGAVVVFIGFAFLVNLDTQISETMLATSAFLVGMGVSSLSNSNLVAVQTASTPSTLGQATSLFHFSRGFGNLAGLALMGGIQLGSFQRGLETLTAQASENPLLQIVQNAPQKLFDPEFRKLAEGNMQALSTVLADSLGLVFSTCLIISCAAIYLASRLPNESPKKLKANTNLDGKVATDAI